MLDGKTVSYRLQVEEGVRPIAPDAWTIAHHFLSRVGVNRGYKTAREADKDVMCVTCQGVGVPRGGTARRAPRQVEVWASGGDGSGGGGGGQVWW